MIADTILKKQDFFDLFKKRVDKTQMVSGSQIEKLESQRNLTDPEEVFKAV